MLINILAIIAGLVILVAGAEALVRGASSIAAKFSIPPLIIGLTVVSIGTSAPELTVSILSAINGSPDLAVGNIVGSNIANILLILGITALIVPLRVKNSTIYKEIPFAFLSVALLFVMGNDIFFDKTAANVLTRTDGITLLAILAIFMYYVFGQARSGKKKAEDDATSSTDVKAYSVWMSVLFTVVGLIGLVAGGKLLVNGAVAVAQAAGLSEALIGLTIVAIGTSLPELATSVVAALKKQADIAIGNIIGSNIFNVLFVLGATSTISPLPLGGQINFDIVFSIFVTILLFVTMFISGKKRLIRWEGGVFVSLYIGYLVFLVVRG